MAQLYAATFLLFLTADFATPLEHPATVRAQLALDYILRDTDNSNFEYWKWFGGMLMTLMMPNESKSDVEEFMMKRIKDDPECTDLADPKIFKLMVLIFNKDELEKIKGPGEQETVFQNLDPKFRQLLTEYENELNSLKDIKLNETNVTLYDFLYMENKDAIKYASSEVFQQMSDQESWEKKFKTYGYNIFKKYTRAHADLIMEQSRDDL